MWKKLVQMPEDTTAYVPSRCFNHRSYSILDPINGRLSAGR